MCECLALATFQASNGKLWRHSAHTEEVLMPTDLVLADRSIRLIGNFVDAVMSDDGPVTIRLDPNAANMTIGGEKIDGDLLLKDEANDVRVHLSAGGGGQHPASRVTIDGRQGTITLKGDLVLASIGSLVAKIQDLERRIAELERR
jgi:hypothetical protein